MPYSFYNVASTGFAFCPYHRSAFTNTPECLTEVSGPAYEGNLKFPFIYMVFFIGRSKYFTFIYIIDTYSFKYLGFSKMSYTCFCHNWY